VVSCTHDGYRRLPGRPVHRREWRFRPGGVEIRDRIEGGFREAVARFHFHPDVQLTPIPEVAADTSSIIRDCPEFFGGGADSGGNRISPCFFAGRLHLPDGREITWRILAGRGRLTETTWHPEFGRTVPNRCLEVQFAGQETVMALSW